MLSKAIADQMLHHLLSFVAQTKSLRWLCIMGLALLLAGCANLRASRLALPLSDLLPLGWTAVGDPHEISIDNDATIEYLIFFTYDSTADAAGNAQPGPIGALIYDPLPNTPLTTTVAMTNSMQGINSLTRFQVLPSYWLGGGDSFVAEPEDATALEYFIADYSATDANGLTATRKELVVRGGASHLTFIWWNAAQQEYGATQIHAPGGFSQQLWATLRSAGLAPEEVSVLAPLHDRNLFCRHLLYRRDAAMPLAFVTDGAGGVHNDNVIHFISFNTGLTFCHGLPTHPFYPEGVVLAWLIDPQNHAELVHESVRANPDELARWDEVLQGQQGFIINNITGERTITATRAQLSAVGQPIESSVCVELITAADTNYQPLEKRWYSFTLRHRLMQSANQTPQDILEIVNVNEQVKKCTISD